MNDGWVRWFYWHGGRLVDFGQMPKADVSRALREFETRAAELLQKTNADHVLYGLKLYNERDELNEVRFYQKPMTDEQFEKDVASKTGMVAYALHARK